MWRNVFRFLPYPLDHPAQLLAWSDCLLNAAHLSFERYDTLEQLIDLDGATPRHGEILPALSAQVYHSAQARMRDFPCTIQAQKLSHP
jgi:hypothetical protein